MNKILTLYNLEFQRIYKLYFGLLISVLGFNIVAVSRVIYSSVKMIAADHNTKIDLGLLQLSSSKNVIRNTLLPDINIYTNIIVAFAVLLCLLYAIAIWYIDFVGKSKVSYTLFMLPQNKFNIYIAKFIMIVVMIYGVISLQSILWLAQESIIKSLINNPDILATLNIQINSGYVAQLIMISPLDFFMINIVGVMLTVCVIFTGVMIQLSYKKIGILLAPQYILFSFCIYFAYIVNTLQSSDRLINSIVYFVVLFVLSIGISYKLLNEKVYV